MSGSASELDLKLGTYAKSDATKLRSHLSHLNACCLQASASESAAIACCYCASTKIHQSTTTIVYRTAYCTAALDLRQAAFLEHDLLSLLHVLNQLQQLLLDCTIGDISITHMHAGSSVAAVAQSARHPGASEPSHNKS